MNYYEILRVPATATLIEIKKAYKALVKRYHPDIYEGNKLFAEYKIKEINEAYEVLKKQNTKAKYDAELNNKIYQYPKSDFVKTNKKTDYEKYQTAYSGKAKVAKAEVKIKKYPKINFDEIIKNYFNKIDNGFKTEEKQDFIIFALITLIIVFSISIIGFLI